MDWNGNNTFLTETSNNIKYLGVTLTEQVKDLYDKSFKTLKKEIKEDIKSWKDCHGCGLI